MQTGDQGQGRGPSKGLGAGKYKHPHKAYLWNAVTMNSQSECQYLQV